MFDYEVSEIMTKNIALTTEQKFQMIKEFKKPENEQRRFMAVLYELPGIDEKLILSKLRSITHFAYVDLIDIIDRKLAQVITFEESVNNGCLIISMDEQQKLVIATDDPFHPERFDYIKAKTGVEYKVVLALHSTLIKKIQLTYNRTIQNKPKQDYISAIPLPSSSRINITPIDRQPSPSSIIDGEYHGRGVSERTSIYPNGSMPEIGSKIPNSGIGHIDSNVPAIYDAKTFQLRHHSFDAQKSELLKLIEQEPKQLPSEPFKEKGGLFNWFDSKVTGTEMNKFVEQLQRVLIDINGSTIKAYKGLNEVYETFEALDQEYIASIIAAIQSAKKAAEKAQSASNEALKAQADLSSTIQSIRQIVEKNTKFKNDIRAIKHIKDVDSIWSDVQALFAQLEQAQSDIQAHLKTIHILESRLTQVETKSCSIEAIIKKNEDAQKSKNDIFDSSINSIVSDLHAQLLNLDILKKDTEGLTKQLQALQSILDQIKHLKDVDQIWESVHDLNDKTVDHQAKIQTHSKEISDVHAKYDQLRSETDNLTQRIEQFGAEQKEKEEILESKLETMSTHQESHSELIESLQTQLQNINDQYKAGQEEIKQSLDSKIESVDARLQKYPEEIRDVKESVKTISESNKAIFENEQGSKKKTGIAITLSGIALVVVILHLLLDLLGVL